jgi:hypothetical protein
MVVHGFLAVIGLVLLLYYTFTNKPGPIESAVLFVIAALGGIVVAVRDITGKSVPKWLATLHGLIAVTGFVFLLLFVFNK